MLTSMSAFLLHTAVYKMLCAGHAHVYYRQYMGITISSPYLPLHTHTLETQKISSFHSYHNIVILELQYLNHIFSNAVHPPANERRWQVCQPHSNRKLVRRTGSGGLETFRFSAEGIHREPSTEESSSEKFTVHAIGRYFQFKSVLTLRVFHAISGS